MADTSLGFRFKYRLCGARPTIQTLTIKDTETLTKGDLVNLETGEIDLGATNDTAFVGAVQETKAGTDSVTTYKVITDWDAVYNEGWNRQRDNLQGHYGLGRCIRSL